MNFRFVQEAGYSENILKFEELLEEFERASQEKSVRVLEDRSFGRWSSPTCQAARVVEHE